MTTTLNIMIYLLLRSRDLNPNITPGVYKSEILIVLLWVLSDRYIDPENITGKLFALQFYTSHLIFEWEI